jgi:hypothetical protein
MFDGNLVINLMADRTGGAKTRDPVLRVILQPHMNTNDFPVQAGSYKL